ncbi:MAG: hypothetical protein ACHQRJ_12700 [Alphaproteobacteria bacterium]
MLAAEHHILVEVPAWRFVRRMAGRLLNFQPKTIIEKKHAAAR